MEPILLEIPESIATARLTLRVPRPGDGSTIAAAVRASLPELSAWLPWATDAYGDADGELWSRRAHGEFHTRQQLPYLIFEGDAYVGSIGAPRIDWRSSVAEIGYWLRTDCVGCGFASEALVAIATMLGTAARFRRIEVRCDARNARSAAVARRCGFALDGTLRADSLGGDGSPRDTHVFSKVFDRDGGDAD